jgi:hypothetical protein
LNLLDFVLYLLSDEKVQKGIKDSRDLGDLLGKLLPNIVRNYLRLDLRRVNCCIRESRNVRELWIRLLDDLLPGDGGGNGDVNEDRSVVPFSIDVSSGDKAIP